MPKSLKTPLSVWTKIFRRIVAQLETNADVRRVVGIDNVLSWTGKAADYQPLVPTATAPLVRLSPNPSGVDWYSPDAQAGNLGVMIEIAVSSTCIDDVVDLWDMLVTALLPDGIPIPATGVSFSQDLVGLGAETGEIVFSDPAFDRQPAQEPQGYFLAQGHFRLSTIRPVH
jgi:hypothetical protein